MVADPTLQFYIHFRFQRVVLALNLYIVFFNCQTQNRAFKKIKMGHLLIGPWKLYLRIACLY